MKRKFNPSGRAAYLALAVAAVIASGITYALSGAFGVELAGIWYAYAAYAGLLVLGVAGVWVGNKLTTYEIGGGELVKRSGILSRQESIIPFEKIDNISTRRSLLDMLLGLSNVYIDTPAGPHYEMIMKSLTRADAAEVVGLMREKAASFDDEEARKRMAGGKAG